MKKTSIILCVIISFLMVSCCCMKTKNAPPPVPQIPEAPQSSSPTPQIVTMDEMTLMGMEKDFTSETMMEIPNLWMEFIKVSDQIPNKANDMETWGVSYDMNYATQPFTFTYFVGFEVTNIKTIPEGMIGHVAPASKYAKFTHYGSLDNLSETYTYIYNVWFPQSGYDMGMGNELELYNKKFNPEGEDSEIFIFIPLQ